MGDGELKGLSWWKYVVGGMGLFCGRKQGVVNGVASIGGWLVHGAKILQKWKGSNVYAIYGGGLHWLVLSGVWAHVRNIAWCGGEREKKTGKDDSMSVVNVRAREGSTAGTGKIGI